MTDTPAEAPAQADNSMSCLLWYYAESSGAEHWQGGFATRDEAIANGDGEFDGSDFYVVSAKNPPVRLADWVNADDVLGHAADEIYDSDRVCSEFDDGPIFEATPALEADLAARIRQACDEWQKAHGLIFTVRTFSSMGEPERIEARHDHPQEPTP